VGVTIKALQLALVIGIVSVGAISADWDLGRADEPRFIIEIASMAEIQPIAELRAGFKEQLAQSPIGGRITYVERNAQGQAKLLSQIAAEVEILKPTLVYVLGTPLAQAIQKQQPNILLLQGAVTDPVAAGLANSWEGSGRMYAATSDRPPIPMILEAISRLTPDRRRLGIIYNPGESNSVAVVKELKEALRGRDLSLQEYGVGGVQDLSTAVASAVIASDALFIPPDNTVTAGLKAVIQAARLKMVPVYATTVEAVDLGALASASTDFRQLGRETADIALEILVDGRKPGKVPIQLPKKQHIIVSSKTAEALDVSLSQASEWGYLIR
jgi:putative ABC transport system substrate-binding protein